MDRREVRARVGFTMFSTTPHPYLVTMLYMLVGQLVGGLGLQVGGQPFVMDLDAMAAGDAENAIRFAPENITVTAMVFLLCAELLYVMLDYGYASYCLHACRGEKCSFFDLMDGFLVFFKALVLRLMEDFLMVLGSMLFIIPGIVVSYVYSQSERLLLDHPDWSPLACMRESRHLMRGRLKEYFFLRLSLLLWNIACLFPFASIFAQPWSQFSETVYYLGITGAVFPDPQQEEKPPWEY